MIKYVVFVVTFGTLGRLPLPALYSVVEALAWVGYYVVGGARRNVFDNLRHVVEPGTSAREMRRLARQVFRNVGYYYADLARLPHMDIDEFFRDRLIVHGVNEWLRPAMREEKGVIMFGAHFGNVELAGQGLIPLGINVLALTEPLHPRLSRFLNGVRSSKGHEFVPASVGNVKRVMKALQGGGVVVLLGDRDIQGPRARLPFCGVDTWMPTGPVEVALRTGAAVVPCFCVRKSKYVIEAWVEEPVVLERTGDMEADVRAGTMRCLERFERRLRAEPGQWAVLEAVWDGERVLSE